jgi:hypothetical protein
MEGVSDRDVTDSNGPRRLGIAEEDDLEFPFILLRAGLLC